VLNQEYGPKDLKLTVEGIAGTDAQFPLSLNRPNLKPHAEGAELSYRKDASPSGAGTAPPIINVHFPPGEGWKTVTVTLTW
jgi:hypothetical protein